MKCSYAVDRKIVSQITRERDENGFETVTTEVINNKCKFLECEERNCGAWDDYTAKCKYNASKDD